MSEKSPIEAKNGVKDALPASPPKAAARNPAFQMMGMPNIRFKLPSRNWLIFLSITGSFTAAVFYDRYHKKKAQRRWCNIVSHLAREPFATTGLPRRITIFLSAPPGDSLRAAREHFHEYVKPVLVAGAMDWDVIEGRREGDVRAGLAGKIRKRRRKEEGRTTEATGAEKAGEDQDLVQVIRDSVGVKEMAGVQGDLVLGRNTWKEYVRGLHEGWLGPLEPPPLASETISQSADTPLSAEKQSFGDSASPSSNPPQSIDSATQNFDQEKTTAETPKTEGEQEKEKDKPKEPTQEPPYNTTSEYPSARLPPSIPDTLPPSITLPFPNILGFFNTPIRIYRFLNRRHLADETGREVAALVLASRVRTWESQESFASSADPDASPSNPDTPQLGLNSVDVAPSLRQWEQESVLHDEEKDWHKIAWRDRPGDDERTWRDQIIIEPRIGERMRRFYLGDEDRERAEKDDGVDPSAKSFWQGIKEMAGWEEDNSVKGWKQALVREDLE
ncbi:MAG: hypothetical protein Q9220_003475 [cf. Caloplaca sp. 1 TL-2023]